MGGGGLFDAKKVKGAEADLGASTEGGTLRKRIWMEILLQRRMG